MGKVSWVKYTWEYRFLGSPGVSLLLFQGQIPLRIYIF